MKNAFFPNATTNENNEERERVKKNYENNICGACEMTNRHLNKIRYTKQKKSFFSTENTHKSNKLVRQQQQFIVV